MIEMESHLHQQQPQPAIRISVNDLDDLEKYLSPGPCSNSSNDNNNSNNNVRVAINVGEEHVFRHAKELIQGTHGGYLDGCIEFGDGDILAKDGYEIHVSTLPSPDSRLDFHPNLLHVTVKNEARQKATWKSALTAKDWRVIIRIRRGKAFLVYWDESSQCNVEKLINCVTGNNRIVLGEGGLNLTVITPLQDKTRGDPKGVRICDVVYNRLKEGQGHQHLSEEEIMAKCEEVVEKTKNRKNNPLAKIEMHSCRLRVEVIAPDGSSCAAAVSNKICNSRNNDVGTLELHDISDPRGSCTGGGFKMLLSSEFKAPTLKNQGPAIRAVFVLEENVDGFARYRLAEEMFAGFNQISLDKDKFQIHYTTLAFKIPPQNPAVINDIYNRGMTLKIALYRPFDGKFSKTKFEFRYLEHVDGMCHFCAIHNPTELTKYVPAGPKVKRRQTSSPNRFLNVPRLSSGDPSSPEMGYYSDNPVSPEERQPEAKKMRSSSLSSNESGNFVDIVSGERIGGSGIWTGGTTLNSGLHQAVYPDILSECNDQQQQTADFYHELESLLGISTDASKPVAFDTLEPPSREFIEAINSRSDLEAAEGGRIEMECQAVKSNGGFETITRPNAELLELVKKMSGGGGNQKKNQDDIWDDLATDFDGKMSLEDEKKAIGEAAWMAKAGAIGILAIFAYEVIAIAQNFL